MSHNLKDAIKSLDAIALDLETVPREPDSPVDHAVKILRHLARHAEPYKRDAVHGAALINSYQDALVKAIDSLNSVIATDTPSGTIRDAIKDLLGVGVYLKGCIGEGKAIDKQPPLASIQIPPKLQGEPADALDQPAKAPAPVPPADKLETFLKSEGEALAEAGAARMVGKKDASKGEGIVQACAQIRGEMANNPFAGETEMGKVILGLVRNIEDAAFAPDTPTFALNANGSALDAEQVRLIGALKEAEAQILALGKETQAYLLAKQQRLRADCDANPCHDVDHELTEAQASAYKAYDDFARAAGYTWRERGLGYVQVGVMSLVRAVAGPTS